MKYTLTVILSLLFISSSFSQRRGMRKKGVTYSLYGQIQDENGKGLPYVSIGVFRVRDSSYVKGAATEANGKFLVQIPAGKFYAKISFLSFQDKTINDIVVIDKDVDLKRIRLKPSITNLDEFEVVEEKRLMELDLDKKVFNVTKDLTSQGGDASEILDNVPSVAVDVEGNISLRGSENVRVLINGKPSGMMGMTTADVLKQMDATQIEKIEVITNPSARYDAEGEVGIINIVLKRDKREGINGSVNANFGYPKSFGGGFNLTFKRKHYNLFTSYGASFRDSPGFKKSSQDFFYPDTTYSFNSYQEMLRFDIRHNFRLGTEIFLNKYNSFTVSGKYSIGEGENETHLVYSDFDAFGEAIQTVYRDEEEDKERNSYDVSFNYRKTFKKKDRLLTFDVQRSERVDNENSTITQKNDNNAADNIENRVFNNEGGNNWLFQADYIHPIKKGKIEFGLKHLDKQVDDDYAVEQYIDSIKDWDYVPGYKNSVLYGEKVSASYLMMGKKIKKFSFQLGLRAELTEVKTELVTTNETNNRSYLNFFPSTHFSYELKKDNSIQLGYSKRIRRPRHYWLLPFFSYSDTRSIASGNPNLNPELTDSYEVGHLKNWKKSTLLSSVYYRYTTSTMDWVTFSDSQGMLQRMPVNLGDKNAYGIEFSGSYELVKWWNIRGSYNFFREIRDGSFNGIAYDVDTYSWSTRLNSKWKIKKKMNLQASFNYRAPKDSPQGETFARYSLDAGFSFDLLKGNGTLAFTAKDIFNSRKRHMVFNDEYYKSENEMQWRSRFVRVSFTYRINQKKKRGGERQFDNFDGGGEG